MDLWNDRDTFNLATAQQKSISFLKETEKYDHGMMRGVSCCFYF